MRVVVATYGTEGDARPFASFCRGLMDAGHEARLLADAATLSGARNLGVPTSALTGNVRAALDRDPAITSAIAKGGGFGHTARALAKMANENAESWLRSIIEAGEGCDVIVAAGLAAFAGFSAADYLGIRSVGAGTIPITPTNAFPSPLLPSRWVPRALNRASHHFVTAILWRAFRDKINAARATFKLPPRNAVWSGHPMLYGVSPSLLPVPRDWPSNARLCGQWLSGDPAWTPPAALVNFLAAGEAPVYIGFGSMTGFVSTRLLDALIHALGDRRALLYAGWGRIDTGALPSNLLPVGDTPHDWLFPRTAAVVHHGGSGTSHSAARSGTPSIVVPFAADQFFWAERLRLSGVAPAAMDARRPKAEAFARALEFTAIARIRDRARTLGETMRAENGVADAVAALERIVSGNSSTP